MCDKRNYCNLREGCVNMAIMAKPRNLAFRVDKNKKDIFLHQSVNKNNAKRMKKSAKQIENQLKESIDYKRLNTYKNDVKCVVNIILNADKNKK